MLMNWFVSPIMRWAAAVLGLLAAILTIYGKGRRDAKQKIEAENNADVLNRTQNAIAAGDAVSRDPERLRENDGHRRD
ncbi:MAG: hypothetical protein AMJ84_03845 [Acidithiobacillales bacterium SM23_46]|nr:MAG: hypothetical protein AMJ84_03845 [Acidithiobacillales bacterium SM23_46]KPL27421.1 MAG: hypothetical protein AMJ72_08950 [Acidithiobacillales bacterium SM1_46]